jgi:hypothetical protein
LGRTVEELLETLSARELGDWAAFYALEPWGSEAAFLRTGIVTALIANTNRDSKRKPEPFVPADFMPDFTGKKRQARLDPKRVRNLLRSSFGKRIKPRVKNHSNRSEGSDKKLPESGKGDGDKRKR